MPAQGVPRARKISPAVPADAAIGSLLGGRYRITALIGRGGMAAVYRAADEELPREVAVKLMAPGSTDPEELGRQRNEIDTLASLNHHALVTLLDAGAEQTPAGERAFIVMELIDGQDMAGVPHRLDGHVPAATRYSVGRGRDDAAAALAEARAEGLLPVLVGGTGLYFKALTEGLAAIPPVPQEVRAEVADQAEGRSSGALHERLRAVDPESAAMVGPSDRSRILRAMEVFLATGQSLAVWRAGSGPPLVDPAEARRIVLDPDRAWLHTRISARADRMVHDGAEAEVRGLAALGLDPNLPAMKAIGVREFLDHFAGKLSLDETIAAVKTETRRYAKRQMTWFRNQMADWTRVDPRDGPPAGGVAANSD